jgi:hypothetical protein
MACLKEQIFFGRLLSKCLAQAMIRDHLQKNIPENVSLSIIHIDQDQEEQSRVQKEKVRSVSLGKPDCPVSDFGRTETFLVEEEDCSTSSFDDDDDDDDTVDEYDYEELLLELKKLVRKHIKLQK